MGKYFLALIASLLLFSCKKASDIGSDLLTDDDLLLTYTDTLTLVTQTDFDSSVRSDRIIYDYLGHIDDPIFGSSEGSLFCQFTLLSSFKDTLPTNTLDSVILYLQFDKFYGDSTFPQSFDVYRVTELPTSGSTYRSDYNFATSTLVGSVSGVTFSASQKFFFGPFDTIGVAGIIRIPLTNAFGNDLLAQAGTSALKTDTSFKQYLPGFLIKPSGNSGKGMAQVDVKSVSTKFSVYYRNKDNDTLQLDFPTALTNFWHDKYAHDYSGSPVLSSIKTGAPAGDAINYIQGQAGLKTSIDIPYLSSLGKVAINKAQLEIFQLYDASNLPAPLALYAHVRDADGKFENVTDYNLISTFGNGYYSTSDSMVDNLSRKVIHYTINISDYLQDVVSGIKTYQPIYISDSPIRPNISTTTGGNFVPYRILIGGSDRTDEYKLKLKLKYSIPE